MKLTGKLKLEADLLVEEVIIDVPGKVKRGQGWRGGMSLAGRRFLDPRVIYRLEIEDGSSGDIKIERIVDASEDRTYFGVKCAQGLSVKTSGN